MTMDAYFPVALRNVQYLRKTYGLPWGSAPRYYMYNIEHLAEVGLLDPIPTGIAISFYLRPQIDQDRWPTHDLVGDSDQILSRTSVWAMALQADQVDETNKKFLLAEPEAIDALVMGG